MQETVKKLLKKNKGRIEKLADEIGVGRATLYNWAKGTTNPVSKTHQRMILKAAKKYGI